MGVSRPYPNHENHLPCVLPPCLQWPSPSPLPPCPMLPGPFPMLAGQSPMLSGLFLMQSGLFPTLNGPLTMPEPSDGKEDYEQQYASAKNNILVFVQYVKGINRKYNY